MISKLLAWAMNLLNSQFIAPEATSTVISKWWVGSKVSPVQIEPTVFDPDITN